MAALVFREPCLADQAAVPHTVLLQEKRRAKSSRDAPTEAAADGAGDHAVQASPNTLAKVVELEERSKEALADGEEVKFVWALVFDMPLESRAGSADAGPGNTNAAVSADGDEDEINEMEHEFGLDLDGDGDVGETGRPSPNQSLKISHEAWMACEKIVASDLVLRHIIPIDHRYLILAIGAPMSILIDEAASMKLLMRLQETKGSLEFHEDLLHFFASNHGGLNEYRRHKWLRRNATDIHTHFIMDKDLPHDRLELRKRRNLEVFTSGICQRVVMNRLQRVGRYSPAHQMGLTSSRGRPDAQILQQMQQRCDLQHPEKIRAPLVHELLVLHGGYRPNAAEAFPSIRGAPVVAQVASYLVADNTFVLKPTGGDDPTPGLNGGPHLDSHKATPVQPEISYDLLRDLVEALGKWQMGPGKDETWYGTLNNYFPLHSAAEIKYLKICWGNPKCLFRSCLIGYDAEAEPKVYDPGPPKDIEHNTFGAGGNILHEHSFPGSLLYQPLEEIRDYFGDDVGLYFAWLGLYTKMLIPNTVLGFITMAAQIYFGGGVSNNPLTMTYSIYVGLWSISFLEAWHRRENELRFLWGTEYLSTIELPRPEFVGITKSNPETGRSYLAVAKPVHAALKQLASAFVVIIFVAFTILSALAAQMVGYAEPDGEGLFEEQKYKLVSAALNLTIIGVYGTIFEALAERLTVWENHRTQTQFDNQLIAKNFVFQFVNNYFVLFYIAFLREVKDPITRKPHPCHLGNCLPELQTQLIVVFTGKTIGKQIAYTIKPFVYKWQASVTANRHTKKLVQGVSKGAIVIPSQMQTAMQEVVSTAGGRNDPLQQLNALKKLRDPYELQNRLMPYEGTFDDFNDRVVQFGYLVLFAPGYSLAPFFALINNVIEIRTSGFKMCYAYQRPVWKARSGIGSWMVVLNVLGFLAVMTNAAMITFVGNQDARSIGLETSGFLDRARQWPLWLRFVVTEHCVLAMRVIILTVSPTMPNWINDAREVLEYRVKQRYLTIGMVEEAARLQEAYENRMNNELERIKGKLQGMDEEDIHQMWIAADYDQSGFIDAAELQFMFKRLGVEMSSLQVKATMEEIDEDKNDEISYEEMIEWLMKKDLWDPARAMS
eukprot:COSAG02_NODE_1564_length_11912_cov_7.524676_2_plen_1114_part_00